MFMMMATGGLLATANAGPIAATWGLSAAALTLATSLNALANGTSRIFWGWVSDKTGRELAMGVAFLAAGGFAAPRVDGRPPLRRAFCRDARPRVPHVG